MQYESILLLEAESRLDEPPRHPRRLFRIGCLLLVICLVLQATGLVLAKFYGM